MGACGSCVRRPRSSSARSHLAERSGSRRRTRDTMAAAANPSSIVHQEKSVAKGDSACSRSTRSTAAKRLFRGASAAGSAADADERPAADISSSTSVSSLGGPSLSQPRKVRDTDRATHTSTDGATSARRSSYQLHTLAYEGYSAAGDSAAGTPNRYNDGRGVAALTSPTVPSLSLEQHPSTPPQASVPRAPRQALISYLEQYRTLQQHIRPLYRNRRWRLVFSSDVHGTRMWERCKRVFSEEKQRWRHLPTITTTTAAAAGDSGVSRPESSRANDDAAVETPTVSVPVISLMETDLVVPALSEPARPSDTSAEPAVQIVDSHVCVGLYLHHVPDPGVVCVYDRADVFVFIFETPIQSATSPAARSTIVNSPATAPSVSSAAAAGHRGKVTATTARVSRLQPNSTRADAAYADLDDAEVCAASLRLLPGTAQGHDGVNGCASGHRDSTTPERCHVTATATALPSPASVTTHVYPRSADTVAEAGEYGAGASSPSPPPLVPETETALERALSLHEGRSPTLVPPTAGCSPRHHRHLQYEVDDATFSSPTTHSTSAGYSSPPYATSAPSSAPPRHCSGGSPLSGAIPTRVVVGQKLPRLSLTDDLTRAALSASSPLAMTGAAAVQSPNTITTPHSMSEAFTRSGDAGAASSSMTGLHGYRRDGGRYGDDVRHALQSGGGAQEAAFLMPAARTRLPLTAAAMGLATRLSFDGADLVSATTTVISASSVPGAPWREEEDLTSYWPEAHSTATINTATAANTGAFLATGAGVALMSGANASRRTLSGDEQAGVASLMLHHRYISCVSSLGGDETADCYTPRQPRDHGVVHVDPTKTSGSVDMAGREARDTAHYTPPPPGLQPPLPTRGDRGGGGLVARGVVKDEGVSAVGVSPPSLTTAALASSLVRPVSTRVEVLSFLPPDPATRALSPPAAATVVMAAATEARDTGGAVAGVSTPSLGPSTRSSRTHAPMKELSSEDTHDAEPQTLSGGGASRTISELHRDDSGIGESVRLEAVGPLHVFFTTEGDLYVWDPRELQLPPACAAAPTSAAADEGGADGVVARHTLAAVSAQADRCLIRCDGQRLHLDLRHLRCADVPESDNASSVAKTPAGAESVLFAFLRAHAASTGEGAGDAVRASLVKMQLCAVSSRPMPSAL